VAADALLLDLDRTLVDLQSFTDYGAALADVRDLLGSWEVADVPETDWDAPTMACMSVLHSLAGDSRWTQVSEAIARHERAAIPFSTVMPTVGTTLPVLCSIPVGVVTLVAPDVVPDVLALHGIRMGLEVDVVVGRDAYVLPKPEPDGLLAACEYLNVTPARAVMIGDSRWDAQAAARAGIRFIGVPSGPGALDDCGEQEPSFAAAVERARA
jgi:phosphoglycolate phosphatase